MSNNRTGFFTAQKIGCFWVLIVLVLLVTVAVETTLLIVR